MAEQQDTIPPDQISPLLTQRSVPLNEARDAFTTRDSSGRIPIVLVTHRQAILHPFFLLVAIAVIIAGVTGNSWVKNDFLLPLSVMVATLLILGGIFRSLIARVPEGTTALLARGGRFTETRGGGAYFLPPWIQVTHVVTQREIPFDVPVNRSLTLDNVRPDVDTLVTFRIVDPYGFVYRISADDFDQVFHAVCQDILRTTIRSITVEQVVDLTGPDIDALRTQLSQALSEYGVEINKVSITYAQPPAEFVGTEEGRQLAMLQRAELVEKQSLVRQKQTDAEALARQEVLAKLQRDKELINGQIELAASRRRAVEVDAEAEALRLARLEERLRDYPNAAQYDWEGTRLEVAKALAGNTRAVLQVGNLDDIARAFVIRDLLPHVQPRDGSAFEDEEKTGHPEQEAA